jgi:hypothetical protein
MPTSKLPNTLTILFGFGGSGGKTIRELAELVTSDPRAAELAKHRLHVVLCDTDENDLAKTEAGIRAAFATRCPGLDMQVERFSLATNVDAFCDLVEERIGAEKITAEGRRRVRDHWWFNGHDEPFSATRLPLPPNHGAGQCPLVSHFLAWDKLGEFPAVLERIDTYARNVRHMEDYSIDLIVVSSLAGGTGRGCWQTLSLKAREHFGQRGQACRPYGFFLDASVFDDVQRGRPEQRIKLRVNALTGLSELAMWLRSDTRMDGDGDAKGDPRERRYSLPNLAAPEVKESDVLDTDRYMPEHERSRVGRSPIHKAYVFTNESSSMSLSRSEDVYKACANAIYGRVMIGQLRSDDANQPSRAAATATNILYTPVTDIQQVVQAQAKALRARALEEGRVNGEPAVKLTAGPAGSLLTEIRDATLQSRIDAMTARVMSFLTVHDRVPSDPLVRQQSPHATFLSRKANNASRGQNFFDATFARGDAKEFAQQLSQFAKPSVDMSATLISEMRKILKLEEYEERRLDEALSATGGRESATQLIAQLALRNLAIAHADISTCLPSFGLSTGGGVGPVYAAIEQLYKSLKDQSDALMRRRAELEKKKGTNAIDAAIEAFANNRRRIRIWPWARFGKNGREAVMAAAARAREAADLPQVYQEFHRVSQEMLKIIEEWRWSAKAVIEVLRKSAANQEKEVRDQKKAYFTVIDPALSPRVNAQRMLERLQTDELSAVNRARRMLRPLFDEARFNTIVEATLGEIGSTTAAQEMFIEQLVGGKKGDRISESSILFMGDRRSSDKFRFQQGVENELLAILAKQGTPADALREFSLPSVLQELVEHWCAVYSANRGDETFCRELSDTIERICGLNLLSLGRKQQADEKRLGSENLEAPSLDAIMSAAALQLARKCDPLILYAPDKTKSGDLVTILLPDVSFGTSTNPGQSWQKRIDADWQGMGAEFAFVKVQSNAGNPYMLVAVSDHPKRDFDKVGWTGWISFDYWNDPALLNWMNWIEDAEGKSVFLEGTDDSIGLGYLDPSVVKVQHWARRRWRPWFDPTREKTQDRRKWEALAYALLGNELRGPDGKPLAETTLPSVKRYREFLAAFEKHVVANPSFPAERWSLPVIEERNGDREPPRFGRSLFSLGTDGLRWDNGIRTEKFGSMRNFVEWFKSEESGPVLAAMWQEQIEFAKLLAKFSGSKDTTAIHDVTSDLHRNDIRLAMAEYVRLWSKSIEANVTRQDDRDQQTAFLDEFLQIFRLDFDLLRPFDSTAAAT